MIQNVFVGILSTTLLILRHPPYSSLFCPAVLLIHVVDETRYFKNKVINHMFHSILKINQPLQPFLPSPLKLQNFTTPNECVCEDLASLSHT